MKAKLYLLFLLAFSVLETNSQVLRAFTPRYSNTSVRGNIVYVSNSIISTTGIGSGNPGTGETPPSGSTRNGAAGINIDMDGDASTFNSSSADLSITATSCNQVLFAGLYWGAGQGGGGAKTSWITGETTCKLKIPGSSAYTTITSSQTDYWNNTLISGYAHTGFQCFKDITSLINTSSPNGTYTLANVASPAASSETDAYGGWTIVIVYTSSSLPIRNLTVFDGCAAVKNGGGNVDVSVSGFLTPPSGTVSCELGTVVFDGDRGSSDGFQFKQTGAASFYDLATTTVPLNGAGDAWNSKISYKGSVVTSRNPAFNNTLGYDASIFDLPNTSNAQLGNSKTGATVRFFSNSENVIVQVLSTSISQYNPSFKLTKTSTDVNGGSLVGTDVLRYRIDYKNVGNDASTNSIITDNIPNGVTYKPGTITVNGVSKTDGTGDDQAEYDVINNKITFRVGTGATSAAGGTVTATNAVTDSGYVEFDVYAPISCAITSCTSGNISNSAKIDYVGNTSASALYDSSGTNASGCFSLGPVTNTVTGSCYTPKDTILVNTCPSSAVTVPVQLYGGYRFYSTMPFTNANAISITAPYTSTRIIYAYWTNGSCSDTITIRIYVSPCPDIDDDNDGIPDYVEANMPAALQDLDNDGILNFQDTDYPGFVDHNSDGINDNFDPSADSDNDGIPNFLDHDFPGFVDANSDGVNDNFDSDQDGIPNFLDLDSDNDGIPDVVESGGVDANGDGIIDNYSDTDSDGLSQNVDASNTGATNSGLGLGALDTDGDGVPNYLDLDSDNDGVPDVIEVYGTDNNHDGKIDNYVDIDGDGFADSVDGDVGNDGTAENSAAALLRTGADINSDGRADSYPYKNMDADGKPNPYDLDSDGDGITDVREAGYTDANNNGQVDGAINSNGWNTAIALSGTLNLPNTDGTGRANLYDIDSDDDGIPDNIEGQVTSGYFLPTGSDTDGDGIDNAYDNIVGFGGNGVTPIDTDGENIPDYMDLDTDSDGILDIIEGNDLNLNGLNDDNIILTGVDTDGDGLDDFFDNNNSSAEGTSARMGNAGSVFGDVSPGSITTVQRSAASGCSTERDWRCIAYILDLKGAPKRELPQRPANIVNSVLVAPNPVKDKLQVIIKSEKTAQADVYVYDATGKKLMNFKEDIKTGSNTLIYPSVTQLADGIYYLHVKLGEIVYITKFKLVK